MTSPSRTMLGAMLAMPTLHHLPPPVPDFPPLWLSHSLLRAALNNPASNQGKLQLYTNKCCSVKCCSMRAAPSISTGSPGLQGEGSCSSPSQAPNVAGDQSQGGFQLTQPHCRDRIAPNSPPSLELLVPVPVTCRIRVRLELSHGETWCWSTEHCRNWGPPSLPWPPAVWGYSWSTTSPRPRACSRSYPLKPSYQGHSQP